MRKLFMWVAGSVVIIVAASVALVGSGTIGNIAPGWRVTEDCTPVSVADSAGSVGSLSLSAAATGTSVFAGNNLVTLTSDSGDWSGRVVSSAVTGGQVTLDAVGGLQFLNSTKTAPACGNFTEFVTQFGEFGTGDGQFSSPGDVVFDSNGNLFVADWENFRVQKFVPDGDGGYVYSAKVGSAGTGNGQFLGYGTAPGAWFGMLAVDSSDRIYVTDTGNNRVQRFTNALAYDTKWGSSGSGNGQFSLPTGIGIDSSNNVYVVDLQNLRVQKFDSTLTYSAKWGSAGTGDGQFSGSIYGLAVSGGYVYVVDTSNLRVQKFTTAGTFVDEVPTQDYGYGITVDSSGTVFVAETGINIVQKFDTDLDEIGSFGSFGSGEGKFYWPRGVAASSSGLIAVADYYNNRVQVFTSPRESRIHLSEAYQQYVDLCDPTQTVSYTCASDPLVAFPGWTDKVWNKLKQLGAATHTEMALIAGAITVSDIGARTLEIPNRTPVTLTPSTDQSARSIDVVNQNITHGDGVEVYRADQIFTVNVGEFTTIIVPTSASVTLVNNPFPVDSTGVGAGRYYVQDSTYTAVPAATWIAAKGSVEASLNADGQFVLALKGPNSAIPGFTGPFSFASSSGMSRTPELSVTGSGVVMEPSVLRYRTGADETLITADSPQRVDIPFLTTIGEVYDRGGWATAHANGYVTLTCRIPLSANFGEYVGCLIPYPTGKPDAYYRVTQAVIGNVGVDITAVSHTLIGDVAGVFATGWTNADLKLLWSGYSNGDTKIRPLNPAASDYRTWLYPSETLYPSTTLYPGPQ